MDENVVTGEIYTMLKKYEAGMPLGQFIDHTLLKPEANEAQIKQLCAEAVQYKFYSVCVNGRWVKRCATYLAGSDVHIAAVVGFPLGAMTAKVKAYEALQATLDGAHEIDMVIPIGAALDGEWDEVAEDIKAVVDAVSNSGTVVKVIIETGLLTDEQKKQACRAAERAGAQYVKTSTGFGYGGATTSDVRLMRASVSGGIGVKASGGIRDKASAIAMLEAGANRLGTSSGVAIVTT
jgi:deoxyribose-phosphate aldolase